MSRGLRMLVSVVLVLLALVPWAETIVSLVGQNLGGSVPPPPYESFDAVRDEGVTWQVYWHIAVLVVFFAILYLKDTITTRNKAVWALGLFFLWPIVSVVFVIKHVWLEGTISGSY